MILVDSSVWIEFLSSKSKAKENLESIIKDNNQVCICGIILQEVLQGIREEHNYNLVRSYLLQFPFIPADRDTYIFAASLYRKLKKSGFNLPSVDVTIAAIAIMNNLSLYTLDKRHFTIIEKYSSLKLFN